MQEYRYVAADMSSALRLLNEELGPEAILLSSRSVAEGVEVLALPPGADISNLASETANEKDSASNTAADMSDAASRLAESIEALAPGLTPEASGSGGFKEAQAFETLQHELQQVRHMLQSKLALTADSASVLPNPLQYTLLNRISEMGLPVPVARAVTDEIDCSAANNLEQAWQQCLQGLARRLPIDNSDPLAAGGVFAFVGPNGSGKTAAIVKMAARYLLAHSPRDITIISVDSYSTAGRATLENFSRISRIGFTTVDDAALLADAISRSSRSKLVLIDTSSLSPGDPEAGRTMQVLRQLGSRIKILLALPAYGEKQWLAKQIEQYRSTYCVGCILTQIDSTDSPGCALSALMDAGLPLVYSSHGALRPDLVKVANAGDFLALMAGDGLYSHPGEQNSENVAAEDASGLATG